MSEKKQGPLLVFEENNRWIYPESIYQSPLPENYLSGGRFNAGTCFDGRCFALGYYYDKETFRRPLIAISKNNGLDWHYLPLTNLDWGFSFDRGRFESLACAKKVCLSVGYYGNQKNEDAPLLAIGLDNWAFANAQIEAVLPPDFYEGRLKDVHCTTELCLAAGHYRNAKDRPFIINRR